MRARAGGPRQLVGRSDYRSNLYGPDWRLAAEAGVTLSETPYGGVLITAECETVARLSLGLRATGAAKLFDASYGIIPGPLRDPEGGVFSIRTRTRGT